MFLLLLVLPMLAILACPPAHEGSEQERDRMVKEQIAARGVKDGRVLDAMRRVPRHLFVKPELVPVAYADRPLPIGEGQTISQPYIVGLMTEQLRPRREDLVLEVGTGSGYQAAVLSLLVAKVYSIELIPQLAETATARLKQLGYSNVEVRQGDGYKGWPEHAPYDGIIVTAAPERIPEELFRQLRPGGRMLIPVGDYGWQELKIVEKDPGGAMHVRSIAPVAFVPMVPGKKD